MRGLGTWATLGIAWRPCALAGAAHDDEIAASELAGDRGAARGGPQQKTTRLAERDRRDDRALHVARRGVAVECDAVVAVAVQRRGGAAKSSPWRAAAAAD